MKTRYAVDDEERRTVALSFKLKPSHHERLIAYARKEDRSITSLMEKAVLDYFKKVGA